MTSCIDGGTRFVVDEKQGKPERVPPDEPEDVYVKNYLLFYPMLSINLHCKVRVPAPFGERSVIDRRITDTDYFQG